jgi:hypothetical protein
VIASRRFADFWKIFTDASEKEADALIKYDVIAP